MALLLRVPIGVVIVVTAFWGASALIGGFLVLVDRMEPNQLRNGSVDVVIGNSPLLVAIWIGAWACVGVIVQWVTTSREEATAAEEPAV